MSERFSRISIEALLGIILRSFSANKEILGIPESLFFHPREKAMFACRRFGQDLATPLGVAAGPHSQMAQNIIAAWLCGARYFELKTIQTLDELEISKPCIDMQDEGYNCEWSQELKIHEAADEYINAWVLIHVLHKHLGFSGPVGCIFNMSAGYNMEGILKENVQAFFSVMDDAGSMISQKKSALKNLIPGIDHILIPSRISDNITLSTMHGCPPGEIEKIGLYLIREKKLHTIIKLNPTLLGAAALRSLLNDVMGYRTIVPDEAFDHDLKYPDAMAIIRSLDHAARETGVHFGLKLTNTLESINNRPVFPEKEKMMYMSGRALHPISVHLAAKLQQDFGGTLDISFSAGADAFNIAEVLSCGLSPVTVCSDLLKPGGYGRMAQYFDSISEKAEHLDASSVAELTMKKAGSISEAEARIRNLEEYAASLAQNPAYRKHPYAAPNIRTSRQLGLFDCIAAPCVNTCPSNQEIPRYLYHTARKEYAQALEVILKTNPFPAVCGMACDHICQTKCTRVNYDDVLLIREVKRFISEQAAAAKPALSKKIPKSAGIIGAGPSGLACAWFLRLAGFEVKVYEAKNLAGGMVADAIPSFRLSEEAIRKDIRHIESSGVEIICNYRVDQPAFEDLRKKHDFIYIAVGAEKARKLNIPGEDLPGLPDPLKFLSDYRRGKPLKPGKTILVIGGGNTAMDAARTARRLAGPDGHVVLVYRRTRREMPAHQEEIDACLADGVELMELTAPISIASHPSGGLEMKCIRMKMGEADESGRARPVPLTGSEFSLRADSIIPAVGQEVNLPFFGEEPLKLTGKDFSTSLPAVYMGGDAISGGGSIIQAIGDGRQVAAAIIRNLGEEHVRAEGRENITDYAELMRKRSLRIKGLRIAEEAYQAAKADQLVSRTLTADEATQEAGRCLYCDELCNICVSVCPNRANTSYRTSRMKVPVYRFSPSAEKKTVEVTSGDDIGITQEYQVFNIADFCNECGNCTTFCPTSGRPFADKPRFCLTSGSFRQEESAYYFSHLQNRSVLLHKEDGQIASLERKGEDWLYEDEQIRLSLHAGDFGLKKLEYIECPPREANGLRMARMLILYEALIEHPVLK